MLAAGLSLPALAEQPCLELQAMPGGVVMGKDQTVTVSIQAFQTLAAVPRLFASQGKISPVKTIQPGKYQAEYTPPWKKEPDVALLWATSGNAACAPGFTTVRLLSEQKVEARVEPNSRVILLVGKERFGPARADATGRVEIPVTLPPGRGTATLSIAQPGGTAQQQKIKLAAKATPHLGALAVPSTIRADGATVTHIFLFAADPFGRPIANPVFALKAADGSLGKPVPIGGAVLRASYAPKPSLTGGKTGIFVQLLKPWKANRTLPLRLLPGEEVRIGLQSSLPALRSDGESRALIAVTIRDAQGKGLDGLPVRIQTSAGRIGPVSDGGGGHYQTELIAPLLGSGPIRVQASVGRQQQILELALQEPAPLSLSAEPGRLPADGKSHCTIRIRAFAPSGAAPRLVQLVGNGGDIPAEVPLSGTAAEATFRAGSRAGAAFVEARFGAHTSRIEIPLLPGPPASLEIKAALQRLPSVPGAALPVTVLVKDVSGNPVADARVVMTSSVGSVDPIRSGGPGTLESTFHPPEGASGTAVVKAATEDLSAELPIELVPPPADFGLALAVGIEHNLSRIGAPLVSVEGDLRLFGSVFLLFGAGYFGNRIDAACLGFQGCRAEIRLDAVPLALGLSYRFENGSRFIPFVQAGATATFSRAAVSPSVQGEVVESVVAPGACARAGVELLLGPGGMLFDVGYLFAPWLGSNQFRNDLSGLSARLGYRFAL